MPGHCLCSPTAGPRGHGHAGVQLAPDRRAAPWLHPQGQRLGLRQESAVYELCVCGHVSRAHGLFPRLDSGHRRTRLSGVLRSLEPVSGRAGGSGTWACVASGLLGRAALGETGALGEAQGSSLAELELESVGRDSADLGSEPTPTCQQGPGDPYSAPLGLSFPTSTVGPMTPTSSDWDTGLVPPPPASLQSAAPALTEPLRAGAWPQKVPLLPRGGSAAFSWVSGPSPSPTELPRPAPPPGKSGGQLAPAPAVEQ